MLSPMGKHSAWPLAKRYQKSLDETAERIDPPPNHPHPSNRSPFLAATLSKLEMAKHIKKSSPSPSVPRSMCWFLTIMGGHWDCQQQCLLPIQNWSASSLQGHRSQPPLHSCFDSHPVPGRWKYSNSSDTSILLAYSDIKPCWQIWSAAFSNKITTTTLMYHNPLGCQPWVKIQFRDFHWEMKGFSQTHPMFLHLLGRDWITLNRILHGMKGEKDVKPRWVLLTKAHTGKWRTWKQEGRETEIIKEKAFMILITKIHNPARLLFWLRRTFPLRDSNQKKETDVETERDGENYWENWEKQNISVAHSLQQNKLHRLLTNPHSSIWGAHHSKEDPLLPNPLQIPWDLLELLQTWCCLDNPAQGLVDVWTFPAT